ncbi:unnamed protein product [Symbiodinium natans]|uniref:Uncharacterized protein n=1 Tax=Symbiodinium natans TaxID=878477 RepID=A0A812GIQ6_9DINO|nr:unnamed protein product [Symbiodinium natans]
MGATGARRHFPAILPSLGITGVLAAVYAWRRYQRCKAVASELAVKADCQTEHNLAIVEPFRSLDLRWCLLDVLALILKDLGLETACRCRLLCKGAREAIGPKGMRLAVEDADWLTAQLQASGVAVSLAALAATGSTRSAASEVARAVAYSTFANSVLSLWSPDVMGRPPLVAAACCSRQNGWGSSLLTAMLDARAQPEASSPDGWNALMWASQLGNEEDCQVLLKAMANPNAVSADGTSPLLCAVRADRQPLVIVKLLLSYRADPALVPMQSPFDEYVDMDVRQALASAPHRR